MDSRITRSVRLVTCCAMMLLVAGCASSRDAATVPADTEPAATDAPTTTALSTTAPSTDAPVADSTSTGPTGDTSAPTTAAAPTAPTATPPTVESGDGFDVRTLVEALADDALAGRDNMTDGSEMARDLLGDTLTTLTSSVDDSMVFFQTFDVGVNVIAVVPGTDLAQEYVMLGAHYDHLGIDECNTDPADEADQICNGATDNASGVGVAMATLESLLADGAPRRSLIVAFWDAEEDGLLGSRHYTAEPLVPLDTTVAYINFDIQGAVLLPALAEWTMMIGAETGGAELLATAAAAAAASASTLRTTPFSLVFGEGRSDHASMVEAGIPSVFFTDATSGCYHTAADDITAVDFEKLDQQIATAAALASRLANDDAPVVFDQNPPLATYDDAVNMAALVQDALADVELFSPSLAEQIQAFDEQLTPIVEAGAETLDDAAIATLLGGAASLIASVSDSPCSVG